MTMDQVEAAIQKLERLRDFGAGSPWLYEEGRISAPGGTIVKDDFMYDVHAEFIVTLHRTIDAQLAILRNFREVYTEKHTPYGYRQVIFKIAAAILGQPEPASARAVVTEMDGVS